VENLPVISLQNYHFLLQMNEFNSFHFLNVSKFWTKKSRAGREYVVHDINKKNMRHYKQPYLSYFYTYIQRESDAPFHV